METNKIYCIDCIEGMKQLADNSVDLIITSPPYEDVNGAGYKANSKDILFLKIYSEFMNNVFKEMYRILKPNGQLFFNIKHKTHNKKLSSVHWLEFLEGFKQFDLKSYIIWKYAGSFDSSKSRFHLDYEIIYHLSKGDDININLDCDIHDFLTSIWYLPHNIKHRLHPTQMPENVVERILKSVGKKEDIVLDIFTGSGTTAKVTKDYGYNYIGFEINPFNYEIAIKRLKESTQKKLSETD